MHLATYTSLVWHEHSLPLKLVIFFILFFFIFFFGGGVLVVNVIDMLNITQP